MKDMKGKKKSGINYRAQMDETIASMQREGIRPRLLLHVCCAPCSTYCLELLTEFFEVTVLFYNPNITDRKEYELRLFEEARLIGLFNGRNREGAQILFDAEAAQAAYDASLFFEAVKGLESEPEGGARCVKCFELRLSEAARVAAEGGYDFFTTTLSISPRKDADALNAAGQKAAKKYGVSFLPSDFKKKNGFLRSIELSREYDLYRQDYCGCVFSKAERGCARCGVQETCDGKDRLAGAALTRQNR